VLTIFEQKSALRKHIKNTLQSLTTDIFFKAGMCISKHIQIWLEQRASQPTTHTALFRSFPDEVPTNFLAAMLNQKHISISWPHMLEDKLEFLPQAVVTIIFVPGLAFDLEGHRLGRGKGHYDRFLSGLDPAVKRPILIGLCFDEQLIKTVPTEAHDVLMDYLCTPSLGVHQVKRE
jgi:5-formyltetrahydrofolate cyclo-ligase